MTERRKIHERLYLQIKTAERFKTDITFKEVCETKDALPSDIVETVIHLEKQSDGFGQMDDDYDRTYYVPTLCVFRDRLETDEEILARERQLVITNKLQEERDKREYLRLKAKYE